jgi:endo-1,4-beta-xylanase
MRLDVSLLLGLVAIQHALAAPPTVSLLVDNNKTYVSSGPLKIRSILPSISTRKGYTFRFGSTYDVSDTSSWTKNTFATVWNHVVAESNCKWVATEPQRGNITLDKCLGVSRWADSVSATFRG